MTLRLSTALVLVVGLASSEAVAVPISGLGDPISNLALAGGTVIDFDSAATGVYASITLGDVTFAGVGSGLDIGPDFNGSFNTSGGQSLFTGFDLDPDAMTFTFASPVNAFAFNWGAADNVWLLSVFDSSSALLETFLVPATFASNAGEYFGIAHAGIAFATLVDQKDNFAEGDYVFIDDFTYAAGNDPVPEPITAGLLGVGVGVLGLRRRLRKG
jgi:hypothetical protein